MDYRNLFGIAAIILSGAVFLHSLNSANAFPQGPNVSMGSNPMVNFYEANSGTSTIALDPNQDFIITTIMSNSTGCYPYVNGAHVYHASGSVNPFYYNYNNNNRSLFLDGNGKLLVPAGQSLVLSGCSTYYLEGYYTHI